MRPSPQNTSQTKLTRAAVGARRQVEPTTESGEEPLMRLYRSIAFHFRAAEMVEDAKEFDVAAQMLAEGGR